MAWDNFFGRGLALFARFLTDYAEVVLESMLDASGLLNGKTAMMGGPLSRTCGFNKFPMVINEYFVVWSM
jgi:hypothetical protein